MKFIPEERAKKLSFDRMIFKLEPTEDTLKVWNHDFEYRFDITLVRKHYSYFYYDISRKYRTKSAYCWRPITHYDVFSVQMYFQKVLIIYLFEIVSLFDAFHSGCIPLW